MKHFVIYIPGLGGNYDKVQRVAFKLWRVFGIQTQFVAMNWDDKQSYDAKYARVREAIKAAERKGYSVSLVGASAGGSMALNVAAHHPNIHSVVILSGAINPDIQLSQITLERLKAFGSSIDALASSLPNIITTRIHTLHGVIDHRVASQDSILPGAHNHTLPTIGHMFTIASCLTIFSWYIVSLITHTDL
jgi:dienelactone hydrolase